MILCGENKRRIGKTNLTLEQFYCRKGFNLKDRVKIAIQKWCLKNSNKIIVPAKYLRRFLVKNYSLSSENICVIYNGVKIIPIRARKKKNRLISVARLVSWKNVDQIIKTLSGVDVKFEYRIVGSGPELVNLKRLAKRLRLTKQIKFLGKVSLNRAISEIAQSEIFILNSSYEGLPHVLLEAASVKTAIVTSELPGITEVFTEEEAGLFNPQDKQALKRTIEKLLVNDKKREGLANAAYEKVKNNFSWKETARETRKILSFFTSPAWNLRR